MPNDSYQRFFDDLAPRLEKARKQERELDSRLARRFNALDYLRTDELGLSRIMADLLNPEGKHGQGALFLKRLLDGFQCLATPSHLDQARVEVEKTIGDDRRLDICVHIDDDCCLAIENKPYAGDQEHQIEDYLDWLGKEYEKSLLIYLSPQGEPPSSASVKLKHLSALKKDQFFKIMPYHAQGIAWEDGFDDYRTGRSLTEWLADCRKNCGVDRLRWFLHEAETFCTRKFGEKTVASSETNAIKEFVFSDKGNFGTALAICQSWPEIRIQVCSRFLEMIWKTCRSSRDFLADLKGEYSYTELRPKDHIEMYKPSWKGYEKWTHRSYGGRTHLRLEAKGPGPCDWYIGICSPNDKLSNAEKERRQKLVEKLVGKLDAELGQGESRDWWLWWEWIDEKYRNWDVLLSDLHRECEDGPGEITDYFVDKFAEIAEVAIPIIDRVERT